VSEYGGEPVAGSGVVAVAAPGALSSPLTERRRYPVTLDRIGGVDRWPPRATGPSLFV